MKHAKEIVIESNDIQITIHNTNYDIAETVDGTLEIYIDNATIVIKNKDDVELKISFDLKSRRP